MRRAVIYNKTAEFKSVCRRLVKSVRKSELLLIPGVGKETVKDLNLLGIFCIEDLRGKDPGKLYEELSACHSAKIDRCVLYVFRCAVYFSEEAEPDPEKLKWWYWKD